MPLFAFACPIDGAQAEKFCHVAADLGAETMLCRCGSTMAPTLSVGAGLTWFEEGRGRWIHNLGPQPIYVTSHEQHKREMKKAGVEWATGWNVKKSGGWV